MLVELLTTAGGGATALALIAAREICRDEAIVVVDPAGRFFPPAAARLGLDLSRLIFVRPRSRVDYLWTLNQALRCPAVGGVLSWPDKLDARAFRTLQLAAEAGETTGLLVRPARVRGEPTWSEAQWFVEPLPTPTGSGLIRRLRVEVVRCRRGKPGAFVELELNYETGTLHATRTMSVASQLAAAAI